MIMLIRMKIIMMIKIMNNEKVVITTIYLHVIFCIYSSFQHCETFLDSLFIYNQIKPGGKMRV